MATPIDVRAFKPEQQEEFLRGFERYLRKQYKGEAKVKSVLDGAREFMTNNVNPRKNYNISVVPVIDKYLNSNAYSEFVLNEPVRKQLRELTPHEVWMSLSANARAEINAKAKRVEGQDWQETVEQTAFDSIDDINRDEVNQRAVRRFIGGKKKNRLKSISPEQAWPYLSRNAQIDMIKKASEGLTEEERSRYAKDNNAWHARVLQVAHDNIDSLNDDDISIERGNEANRKRKEDLRKARGLDEEADISGFTALMDEYSRNPAPKGTMPTPSPRPTPGPAPTSPNLYDIEAVPFMQSYRPRQRRARIGAIWQTALGAVALNYGLDLAITTSAVVPLTAAGALFPVLGLTAVGAVALAYGVPNIVRAVRYGRLTRNIRRAYLQTDRRGNRLTREQVERSILRSRRLANRLGLDISNMTVLNQGLYAYTSWVAGAGNAVVSGGRRVKAFNRRKVKGLRLYAQDRKEVNAMEKEFKQDIKQRSKQQKTTVRQANRAIKTFDKQQRKYGDAAVHTTSREAAERMLNEAAIENARINDAKYVGKTRVNAEKQARAQQRTLKTGISPARKQELLREFRESLGPDGLKEFNALSKEEREARVKEFVYNRYNEQRLRNRVKAKVTGTSRTTRSSTRSSTTTRSM